MIEGDDDVIMKDFSFYCLLTADRQDKVSIKHSHAFWINGKNGLVNSIVKE